MSKNTQQNDGLAEQVHLHIRNAMYNARWGVTVEDAGHHIIALVRADERRRIREQLLSSDAVAAASYAIDDSWDVPVKQLLETAEMSLTAALAATGLTEEGGVE